MKHIIATFLMGFLVLQLAAQVSQEKKSPTLVFHVFNNDFKTAQQIRNSSLKNVLDNHLWSKLGEMQTGLGFNYLKGINGKIDVVATLDGSWTDYLYKDGSSNGSSEFLFDANAGLNLKPLTDLHTLVPYLFVGTGLSLYKGKAGFYIPVGVGLQFNLFNEAFVFTNMQYRFAITSTVNDHLYYTIGIGTNIGKKKIKPAKLESTILSEPKKNEIINPTKDILIAVYDEATGQPLPSVEVKLIGSDGKKLNGLTDTDGKITFNALVASDYTVSGMLNNINSSVQIIKKGDFEINGNQINISLTHNDPRYTLSGVVVNKTRNLPEGGATINVTNDTKHSITIVESQSGDGIFLAQLEAESDFTLVGKKAGYISNIEKISTRELSRSITIYVKLNLVIEEAKVGQSIVLNNIYFEVGKANLNTSFSSDLNRLIQFLTDNPDTNLEIQGHTDNTGSLSLNTALSQARASSVVNYLLQKGIDERRLSAKGFGPSEPVASNDTTEGRAKNRRVVMKVL